MLGGHGKARHTVIVTYHFLLFLLAKEAEKQDLAALESLIAKAQKARDIQTKVCRN